MATDGQEGNGFQVENVGPLFPSSSLASHIKSVKADSGLFFLRKFICRAVVGGLEAIHVRAVDINEKAKKSR